MKKRQLLKQSIGLALAGILAIEGPLSGCKDLTRVWALPFSEEIASAAETARETQGTGEAAEEAELVGEDTSKREAAEKHFLRSDFSMEAVLYPGACRRGRLPAQR